MSADWKPTLKKIENMDESHLCNTVVCESKFISHERRNECRMELIKRWTKQLHNEGIRTSIVTVEPEIVNTTVSKKPILSMNQLISQIVG